MSALRPAVKLDDAALSYWRRHPVEFIEQCLVNPETGKPFELLDAEREFLKHAFKTDKRGRLLYPTLIYGAVKKSGKTVFGAMLMITMVLLFGPRFAEGYAVANDQQQAQSRVFEMARRIVEASPMLRREAKVTADKIIFTATAASITALSTDYASAAGAHPTCSCFDEIWAYTSERARRMWDECVPVPSRRISCRLIVSHAGFADESDLLHELYQRGLKQPLVGKDLYAGDGMLMFWSHEPIAPWQDAAWLEQMRRELRTGQYLRMAENRWVTSELSFIDMAQWDACTDPDLGRVVNDRGLPVWVGVDASVKHDSTAIVAVSWDQRAQKVRLCAHAVYQPSAKEHLDFELAIEGTLLDLRKRFRVMQILFDPYQMQATAQRLARAGLPVEEFAQSQPNLTAASQNLYDLIQGHNLAVYPDSGMRLAVSRAVAIESPRGWRIAKEKQSHKIDVVVALAMAAHACVQDQSTGPVIIPDALLHRLANMPRRREFGSSRTPQTLFRFGNTPPADRQCYPQSFLPPELRNGEMK